MVDVDDIVKEFLVESLENLDQLDRDLMALEESPNDRARLSSVFRTIHTIKGTSGFLAFQKLEHLTHVGESLLVRLRDGVLGLNSEITTELLRMVDAVRKIVSNIETTGKEGDDTYSDLIDRLGRLQKGETLAAAPAFQGIPVGEVVQELSVAATDIPTVPTKSADELQPALAPVPAPPPVTPTETPLPAACTTASGLSERAADEQIPLAAAQPSEVAGNRASSENVDRGGSVADSTVRIDVNLLDDLMNLVGELVLARNQIMQFSQRVNDSGMASACQRLNLIATELQGGVMKTRMQPIGNAWSKLPRVVRDLSLTCGKQVQVKLEGAETELDKTILESIKDPLTHIVRNAVDHGIESPAVRVAAGKPPEGTLLLRAFHEGGQVNIEISDDGGGINLQRVRQKAVERGLVTPQQADAMGDREAVQLILLPGFSTAEKVTNVSGRGVGMDVVKTNIDKIGGVLDIQSTLGLGTVLRIKIPLTLAIVPALVVSCEGDRYCIPQVSLLELVRLGGVRVHNEIELLHSVPVHRLRGRLLPLVYLDEQLGLRAPRIQAERQSEEIANIVVLQAEDRQFGLIVDRIVDTQEIVVKPLGSHLKGITTYAGSTIMGDGTVSFILDVIGLAEQSKALTEQRIRAISKSSLRSHEVAEKRRSWLVVDPGNESRAAMLLSAVDRLEHFDPATIERVGHEFVVQYRGNILPLIRLAESHNENSEEGRRLPVVVYSGGGRPVGLVVERILDIVEDTEESATPGLDNDKRVLAGKVTQIIDLSRYSQRHASI